VLLAQISINQDVDDLAASGDRLCILDRNHDITLVDTTTPGQPIFGTTLSNRSYIDLDIRNRVMYASYIDTSTNPGEIRMVARVINDIVSPPAGNDILLGTGNRGGYLARRGQLLVATAGDSLVTLDLASTPANPPILGVGIDIRPDARPSMTEHNGTTYVHLLTEDVTASPWDVTNPASPVFRSSYGDSPDLLAAVGNVSYLWNDNTGESSAFTLAVPALPLRLWSRSFEEFDGTDMLSASGTTLVTAKGISSGEIRFYDAADPSALVPLSTITISDDLDDSDVSGNLLAFTTSVTTFDARVLIYDIADPANPVFLSDDLFWPSPLASIYTAIELDGSAAVVELENAFALIDLRDPSNPVEAYRSADIRGLFFCRLDADILTVHREDDGEIDVIDVSDPYRPVTTATISEPGASWDPDRRGRLMGVVRANDDLALYDLSIPSNPVVRSVTPRPASLPIGGGVDARFAGSFCLLTSQASQVILDTSNPASPITLSDMTLGEYLDEAALINDVIWARGSDGLYSVRIAPYPVITQNPADRNPCPGAAFTLSADATSDTPMSYRWRYNGAVLGNGPMPNGSVVAGAFTRTLTITNFNPADGGVFNLRFTNDCGSVTSEDAVVASGGPPRFYTVPSRRDSCPFTPVTMSVTTSFRTSTNVRWQIEFPANSGTFVNLSDFSTQDYAVSGSNTPTLTLTPLPGGRLVPALETRYRAVASSVCGSTTSTSAPLVLCQADVNCDLFLDFFDYDDFVAAFESGTPAEVADFNADGFVDFFDYDDFVEAFESGC
jgi:hypothetical protein